MVLCFLHETLLLLGFGCYRTPLKPKGIFLLTPGEQDVSSHLPSAAEQQECEGLPHPRVVPSLRGQPRSQPRVCLQPCASQALHVCCVDADGLQRVDAEGLIRTADVPARLGR